MTAESTASNPKENALDPIKTDTSGPTDAKVTGILDRVSRVLDVLAEFIDGDDRVNKKGLRHKDNPYA